VKRSAWLLVPGGAWLALFTFVPLAIVVAISLVKPGHPITWELDGSAWSRLFDARWTWPALRSLGAATATTIVCLVVGAPLALFVARRPERTRRIFYFLVLLPLWANSLALTYAWIILLRTNGIFDQTAHGLGLLGADGTLGWLNTMGAVIVGLVYVALPFMVYSAYASIEKFDWRLLEAAQDLGATRAAAMRRVFVPAVRPGLVAGCVLVFISTLGAMVAPKLLGGSKMSFLGNAITDEILNDPTDYPLAAAMAVALLAFVAGAMWIYRRFAAEPEMRT
jgi:spermidine/putrescine transport system permease protein